MKRLTFLLIIFSIAVILNSCGNQKKQEQSSQLSDSALQADKPPVYALTAAGNPIVVLNTIKGNIELEVFEKEAPNHASNFLKLIKGNYYDGLIFYHVTPDVEIESGDMTGTGIGGPGYDLEPEKTPFANKAGFVGMVPMKNGKCNGSRFYILIRDNPQMDKSTGCFAKVISGMENVVNISKAPAKKQKPIAPIKIITGTLKLADNPANPVPKKTSHKSTK